MKTDKTKVKPVPMMAPILKDMNLIPMTKQANIA